MSGVQRFRAGALATLLSQVIQLTGHLALVPLFLAAWGEVAYGEWLTLSAAVAYLSVLDLGVQNHVVNRMCVAWTAGDHETYQRVLRSALGGSVVVCVAVLALVAAVGSSLPLASWLDLQATTSVAARWVAVLLAGQVLSAIPLGIVVGVYRTLGEYARGVMVANARAACLLGGTALVLTRGGSVVEVAAVQLVPIAATFAFALADIRRRHPTVRFRAGRVDGALLGSLLLPSSYFLLVQVAFLVSLQGGTLVVHALFGAAAVTVFCTQRTLANLVRQLSGSLGHALWPQATELYVRGDRDTLREVHRLATKLTLAATVTAAAVLWFVGADIIRLWTDGAVAPDRPLLAALLVVLVSQGAWSTSAVYLMAWGRQRLVALPSLWSAALGLLVGVALGTRLGPSGVIWGLGAVEVALCGTYFPRLVCRELGESRRTHVLETLGRGVPVVALLLLCGAAIEPLVVVDGWLRIAWLSAGLAPLSAWLTFRLWLTRPEQQRVLRLLRSRAMRGAPVSAPGRT